MKEADIVGPVLTCADAKEWEAWLGEHHESLDGAWLRIAKKGATVTTLSITEALDVALCFGWIDSRRRRLDDDFYLQRYSRRSVHGSWSQVNVAKVNALIKAGRMRPPGLTEVEAAQADGRWAAAYPAQRTFEVPPSVLEELRRHHHAATFETLGRTRQFALLLPYFKATTAEQRERRLTELITQMEDRKASARSSAH